MIRQSAAGWERQNLIVRDNFGLPIALHRENGALRSFAVIASAIPPNDRQRHRQHATPSGLTANT